ncbi:serglycin [Micropterus dolomieu]|uniref:serglycin n=1 Tax=Micropterus dolomieu TaxID=147949 RepID=UPI001E8EAFD0|nr:serglycin [Micropterus dolomieu]
MKLILFFVISCLALHNGKGAPRTAVYKFVRCNPEGDQANCVTQQSPEMAWSPDLPAKLPASTAQYLEAEPVEDESPEEDEDKMDEYEEMEEEETPMMSEKGESPVVEQQEEGSGVYEGSATEGEFVADQASITGASETGSGESWTEKDSELNKGWDTKAMRRLFPSRSEVGESKPAEDELREDHLLQL